MCKKECFGLTVYREGDLKFSAMITLSGKLKNLQARIGRGTWGPGSPLDPRFWGPKIEHFWALFNFSIIFFASLCSAYYFFNMLLFQSSNSKIFQPRFTQHMISHPEVFVSRACSSRVTYLLTTVSVGMCVCVSVCMYVCMYVDSYNLVSNIHTRWLGLHSLVVS